MVGWYSNGKDNNMKRKIGLVFSLLYCSFSMAQQPVDYVNTFIGTGAVNGGLSGNNYPGATVPFGMVQLSPDTRQEPGWAVASGYDYNDKRIYGFSHTHLSGTGVGELCDILLLPVSINAEPGKIYTSAFSHTQEKASAGYYSVHLDDYNVDAELTATTHVGVHRYTYKGNQVRNLIFDLNHSTDKYSWDFRIVDAQIRIVDDHTIQGYRVISSWAKLRRVYFYAQFSGPIINKVLTSGNTIINNGVLANGSDVKADLCFDATSNKPLVAKVALSPVSIENARNNMQNEVPGWDFQAVVKSAKSNWNKELSKITVDGTETQKEIFYTALYHTFIQPNTMSDVNGDFMASDYSVRKLDARHTMYSTFSLWDTYRAAHPLYTLVQKSRSADMVNSMISQYEAYGHLPVWQLWGQDNYCMIGTHSIPVIVDAVCKGISGIDMERAYEAVKQSSLRNHINAPFDVWEKYGYMPENIQTQSVSITLETAFDDWCVAQLAKKLHKEKDYQLFMHRSAFYTHLFNSQTGFFQAKDDKGKWLEPFDPFQYGANGGHPFTEGNAWQYFWYVPQNIPNLIKLTGGDKAFAAKLDSFFTSTRTTGEVNGNASGFIGQYAHGNEPSHHVAYLYNYAGQPWKTQFYVAKILKELYNTSSSGYAGNEDCGQMSAWYVLSAMGFYPVNPASGVYVIGMPLLNRATVRLENGHTFSVKAVRKSDNDIYIQSATLNGKPYNKSFILHTDMEKGGELVFVMGNKPSASWGIDPVDRPVLSVF